jgi:hypothetical protein
MTGTPARISRQERALGPILTIPIAEWYNGNMIDPTLPGSEWIQTGIGDLAKNKLSVAALLVSIGAPRLRRLGITVPDPIIAGAEHRLYQELYLLHGDAAHSQYNALIRRLVSFERAACVG